MARLSEERFRELWETMPDRPEETRIEVGGDLVGWMVGEYGRIIATLRAIDAATGGTPGGEMPDESSSPSEAVIVALTAVHELRIRLTKQGARLEIRERQLIERAVEWGRAENRLFVDVARKIAEALDSSADGRMTIVASSSAPLSSASADDEEDDFDDEDDLDDEDR